MCFFVAASPLRSQNRFPNTSKVIEEVRQKLGAPGMSVAIVVDDKLAYSAGFGLADIENEVPAKGNTVYRIASIAKPFGATAILQLAERGKLNIDDTVQRHFPAFSQPTPITLRQIMTHTSGIRHYKPGENPITTRFKTIADGIAIFKDDPLLFPPGTKAFYSTYAYNLLAGVVESVTGQSFETYFNENILKPAGMKETFLEYAERIVPHRARQYEKRNGQIQNAPYADLSSKWTGGGIISTAEDLARFHIALDVGKLVGAEMLTLMNTPGALKDGTKIEYSLGWELSTNEAGHQFVDKYGSATGGSTYLLRLPQSKFAVAILCNLSAGNIHDSARKIADSALAESRSPGSNSTGRSRQNQGR